MQQKLWVYTAAVLSIWLAGCNDAVVQKPAPDAVAEATVAVDVPVADVGADTGAELAPDAAVEVAADVGTETAPPIEDSEVAVAPDVAPDVPPDIPGTPCQTNADCPVSTVPCTENRCKVAVGICQLVMAVDKVACEDGEPCTLGDSCASGVCMAGKNACGCLLNSDCAAFDDGNACNGQWVCDKGGNPTMCKKKIGSVVICPPSDNPCATNQCNPVSGACDPTPVADGAVCEDGKICTAGDNCLAGACVPGEDFCPCKKNADCTDDGDLCNGLPYCDKSALPWTCATNPGTVINCSASGDTACSKNTCDPKKGLCAPKPGNEGGSCNDGDPCTGGDACAAGVCKGGANLCGCQTTADCAKLEDGDLCNGTLFCNQTVSPHICETNPATVVVCPTADDTGCNKNKCAAKTGKCGFVSEPDAKTCDDGNLCTPDDACKDGKCLAKTNTCPCSNDGECAPKDDGNLCNGTLFCNKAKFPYQCEVNPATIISCPSGKDTLCDRNLCAVKTGLCAMQAVNEQSACDADGNPCTVGDVCKSGACVAGPNNCPCSKDTDCANQEDGDVCNGTLYCNKITNTCAINPNTIVTCPSVNDTTCIANTCVKSTGKCSMTAKNQGAACDADGNPCTQGDTCDTGVCVAGANTCACANDAGCAPLEDGNKCNGTLYCDKTALPYQCKIKPNSIIVCSAANTGQCKKNACNPDTGACGLVDLPTGTQCDDNALCTVGDICDKGNCIPGTDLCQCQANSDCASQEDGNYCNGTLYCDKTAVPFLCKVNPASVITCDPTNDSACVKNLCAKGTGLCLAALLPANAACDDGSACTVGDGCVKGDCVGSLTKCDDGDACTFDTCDPIAGCLSSGNKVAACDDDNPCTADDCDLAKGCAHTNLDKGNCDDANPCTGADSCLGGACKGVVSKGCDDGNPCTDDGCGGDGVSCTHAPNHAPCSFGRFCDGGHCGGCEAFQRQQRGGCDLVMGWPYYPGIIDACKGDNAGTNKDREELEDAAELSDGRLVAVGAASFDGTQKTSGWVVWYESTGKWVTDKAYGAPGDRRLQGVVAGTQGDAWAVGIGSNSAAIARPWLVHFDGTGKTLSELSLPADTTGAVNNGGFEAVARLKDGGVVAVGWQGAGGGSATTDALVARFDALGNLKWQKVIGKQPANATQQSERLWAVVATADGQGVVAAGQRDVVNVAKAKTAQNEGWLIRMDLQGELVWQRDHGGSGHDILFAVREEPEHSLTAAGTRDKPTPGGWGDGWVLRADSKGIATAQVTLVGFGDDALRTIAPGPLGGWLVGGTQLVETPPTPSWNPGFDHGLAWAQRLDKDLKTVWKQTYDQDGIERILGGGGTAAGDLLLVGDTRAYQGETTVPTSTPDGFVVRLDPEKGESFCSCGLFNKQDAVAYAPARLEKVITLPDNTVVAVGSRSPPGQNWDGALQKMDANGTLLWTKTYGKAGDEKLLGVAQLGTGFVLVGETNSAGAGKKDGWIVVADSAGKQLQDMFVGGTDDDALTGVVADGQGGFVAVGWTKSGAVGEEDAWMLRFDATGKKLWEKTFATSNPERLTGVTIGGDAAKPLIVGVGWMKFGTGPYDLVNWVEAVTDFSGTLTNGTDGKPLFRAFGQGNKVKGDHALLLAVRTLDNGKFAATGNAGFCCNGGGTIWVVLDKNGEPEATGLFDGAAYASFGTDVVPDLGGTFTIVGSSKGGTTSDNIAWSCHVGADNKIAWVSTVNQSLKDNAEKGFIGATRLANGQVFTVGQRADPELGQVGWWTRQDRGGAPMGYSYNGYATDGICTEPVCSGYWPPLYRRLSKPCDDHNECTSDDYCHSGACKQSTKTVCDDNNPCTTDACWPESGCFAPPVKDGAVCGNITKSATCTSGNCGVCPYTETTWGTTGVSDARQIVKVADGYWVSGQLKLNWDNGGVHDAFVTKLDANGKAVWTTTVGTPENYEDLPGIATTADGGAWLYGWRAKPVPGAKDYDVMRVRVGADGKVSQTIIDDVPGPQAIVGISPTTNGGALVAGRSMDAGWFGEYDKDGKQLWQATGLKVNTYFSAIAPLPDGGHILAGANDANPWDLSYGYPTIARYDAKHAQVWASTGSSGVGNYGWRNVWVDANGIATVQGSFWNGAEAIVRVATYLPNGKQQWVWTNIEAGHQFSISAARMPDQSLVLVGQAQNYINTSVAWLARVSGGGQQVWKKTIATADQTNVMWGVTADGGDMLAGVGLTGSYNGPGKAWFRRFSATGEVACAVPK